MAGMRGSDGARAARLDGHPYGNDVGLILGPRRPREAGVVGERGEAATGETESEHQQDRTSSVGHGTSLWDGTYRGPNEPVH